MNELEKIVRTFFSKECKASIYYNLNHQLFDNVIRNIRSYERPDMLSIFENKVIGIEHFEFDSFNRNGKGSEYRTNEFKVQKRFKKLMQEEFRHKDSVSVYDKITGNSSMKNYFNNFQKNFLNHYNKIDDYIEHIKKDFNCLNEEIHICFFAEDVSPLGSMYVKDGKQGMLTPLYSDEIIKMLENSPKVEYLIIGTYATSEHELIIIENKSETLERYKNEHPRIEENDFISFQPDTIGFAIKIPNNQIEKIINQEQTYENKLH